MKAAADSGDAAKVRLLLSSGADPKYRDPNGYSALIAAAACHRSSLGVVRLLIEAGAPLDAASSYGESALSASSRLGRFDIVGALLAAGADPTPLKWTPLARASALGTSADVETDLSLARSHLEDVDRWGRTPWLIAVHRGDVPVARRLLDAGADARAQTRSGMTAMALAASADRDEMLRWLLSLGQDPNAIGASSGGPTPLIAASQFGAVSCVRLLLAAGADPVGQDEYAGTAATAARDVEVLRVLAAGGADLNHIDGCGDWPLRAAARDGDLERVDFLVKAGAEVDRTSTGGTALHDAVFANEPLVVHRLLTAGASVDSFDVDGYTPLHEARSVAVARALLDAGANVHLRGGMLFESALQHHAEHPEIRRLLLRAAADQPVRNI